jgi:hypothetical protein
MQGPTMGDHMTSLRTMPMAAAAIAGGVAFATAAFAAPIDDLPGRWTGWGTISMTGGTSEQVKCIATYFINDGGASMVQNLRCASSSYKIDATAKLKNASGALSGEWEEKTYAAIGSVSGKTTTDGFNLAITGDKFTAVLAVTATGLEIAKISISLGKC